MAPKPTIRLTSDVGTGEVGGEDDVFLGRQCGHEIERLEDEADIIAAQLGQAGVVKVGDVLITRIGVPRGRHVEASHAVHGGRLA